jgi:hypothetical protein
MRLLDGHFALASQFLPVPGGSHEQTEHKDREASGDELESKLTLRNVANKGDDQSYETRHNAQNPGDTADAVRRIGADRHSILQDDDSL